MKYSFISNDHETIRINLFDVKIYTHYTLANIMGWDGWDGWGFSGAVGGEGLFFNK